MDIINRKIKYEELYSMFQLNQVLIDEVIRSAKMNNDENDILKANKRLQKYNHNKDIILSTFLNQFQNEPTKTEE